MPFQDAALLNVEIAQAVKPVGCGRNCEREEGRRDDESGETSNDAIGQDEMQSWRVVQGRGWGCGGNERGSRLASRLAHSTASGSRGYLRLKRQSNCNLQEMSLSFFLSSSSRVLSLSISILRASMSSLVSSGGALTSRSPLASLAIFLKDNHNPSPTHDANLGRLEARAGGAQDTAVLLRASRRAGESISRVAGDANERAEELQ